MTPIECKTCQGGGNVATQNPNYTYQPIEMTPCPTCQGAGVIDPKNATVIGAMQLRDYYRARGLA